MHGLSARPELALSATTYIYDHPAPLARVASVAPTTHGPAEDTEGDSVASNRAGVAAEAGSAPVIVGENMDRVTTYARDHGGTHINDWLAGRTWTPRLNDEFIAAMKQDGRDIVDIGPDFSRRLANRIDPSVGRPPSPIYGTERQQLIGYENYRSVYERWGRFQGGVAGLD